MKPKPSASAKAAAEKANNQLDTLMSVQSSSSTPPSNEDMVKSY